MYQVALKLKIWQLQDFIGADPPEISIRGYDDGGVNLPAELYAAALNAEGVFGGLSVETIGSQYCPTRRDLYLEKKERIRPDGDHNIWGRKAGRLIERFCLGLINYFAPLAKKPQKLGYGQIREKVSEYVEAFRIENRERLDDLESNASSTMENSNYLIGLLSKTAIYELSLLSADYHFQSFKSNVFDIFSKRFIPLLEGASIVHEGAQLAINPSQAMGLSGISTPDFFINSAPLVVGEIKTGKTLQSFHLVTLAGYALAYESHHHVDVNFGAVYFFETHAREMNFAQTYMVFIGDYLRREFLDSRNSAYSIIQGENPPNLADYDRFCKFCKFVNTCYPPQPNP